MDDALGPQHWWPGESRFEIIVGAILTQSTSWTNVEKALGNLNRHDRLQARAIRAMTVGELAEMIRPSGYFRQKASRLMDLVQHLQRHGSLKKFFSRSTRVVRKELLSLNGIGPETADSILLYAGGHPVFVVDAYTRRIFSRHGWISAGADYEEFQRLFHCNLPRDAGLYNQYHALLVNVGKNFCRKSQALCSHCPLEVLLPGGRPLGIRTVVQRAESGSKFSQSSD